MGFFGKQLALVGSYGGTRAELAQVLALATKGKLKPVIYRRYPLEEAAEAQRVMERREQFGKLILIP